MMYFLPYRVWFLPVIEGLFLIPFSLSNTAGKSYVSEFFLKIIKIEGDRKDRWWSFK